MAQIVACVMVLLTAVFCRPEVAAQGPRAPQREVSNVAAFARLYGVVRFFYPSDAATTFDWDRFAVDGIARVRTAGDRKTLTSELRALFMPFGSGIEIAPSLAAYRAPAPSPEPLIAWRYLGAGATDAIADGPYAAKRTNRPRRVNTGGFSGFAQTVPAQELRGKMIRLRGDVRATVRAKSSGGALWLRVDRGAQGTGFFDNMGDRLVRDADWHEYTITGLVAEDATNVVFGVMASGAAVADFDALELSVRNADGTWRTIPIKDPGFEAESRETGWNRVGSSAAQITRQAENAPEGRQFVRFAPPVAPVSNDELFPDAPPAIGDHVDVDLAGGLKARVPLTLTDSQAKSSTTPNAGAPVNRSDLNERLADVVVAWNFYRHFYPYFADAGIDWDARLQAQLQTAYETTTRRGEGEALRRLVADARDGHGRVLDTRQRESITLLPLQVARVESRVVVVASRAPTIAVGAVIASIDGVAATDRFSALMQLVSGSTPWREFGAAQEILFCSNETHARLTFDNGRGPETADIPCDAVTRPSETRPPQIAEMMPGVWYVDLTRARTAELAPVIATLAHATGVIFDVRGYPTDAGKWLLPHLLDAPEHDRWMHVSKIVGPFGQSPGWQSFGWDLAPASPKLAGKIVFLTDGRAISYAESVMGYVAGRHLGTIMGSTTAGTNGNVATFSVPGGFNIIFTGMRVTGHDGRAIHHLVGVNPDVPVAPTIASLRDGHDEVLARALSLMR